VPMNDDSAPDHSLPLFLSSDVEETEQRGSSRILKSGLLGLTALVVGGATLLLGGPVSRITAVTASFISASALAPSPNNDAPASPAQPIIEAQAAPPTEAAPQTEAAAPSNQQPAVAAPEPAEPKQADAVVDREALFRQFQAWAQQHDSKPQQQDSEQKTATQTTRERSTPPQQAAETTRPIPTRAEPKAAAPVVRAPVRAAQKQRPARELRNARAEVESERRAKAAAAQPYWTPAEEARAPDTPAPSTDTPWLLRVFGGHN
jgi:hypothetical protein